MKYEWDEAKQEATQKERGIDFGSMELFEWDSALIDQSDRHGETRFIATGYICGRLHRVVYTDRDEKKRIISLRKANLRDMKEYERRS